MKRCSTLWILREIQINTTRYHLKSIKLQSEWHLYHQSEWHLYFCRLVHLKSLQIINAGECVEKKKPSYTVGRNVNWSCYYGEKYGCFLKTKNRVIIGSKNSTPWHIFGNDENSNSKRYLHPNVHCSTIYNAKCGSNLNSTDWWTDKKKIWCIYTHTYTYKYICI